MGSVLAKLGLAGQPVALVIGAPPEFAPVLREYAGTIDAAARAAPGSVYPFVLLFATELRAAEAHAPSLVRIVDPGGWLWVAYPKKTAKAYRSDLARDVVAGLFAAWNWEPVTQVAIDADWSAIRFRPVAAIKAMVRKTAVSEEGRARIKGDK